MKARDIHDSAYLADIAYNRSYAVARREQSRVLRELFHDLFQKRRPHHRASKACHA